MDNFSKYLILLHNYLILQPFKYHFLKDENHLLVDIVINNSNYLITVDLIDLILKYLQYHKQIVIPW